MYRADGGREKEIKERKAVGGMWYLYSKSDSRLAKSRKSPQDHPQFKNSPGLRAVTHGYSLLQRKFTVLSQTRGEMHRKESGEVPLRSASCPVPVELWTELTVLGNNV